MKKITYLMLFIVIILLIIAFLSNKELILSKLNKTSENQMIQEDIIKTQESIDNEFEKIQEISEDDSLGTIERELNETIILEEDFSDL